MWGYLNLITGHYMRLVYILVVSIFVSFTSPLYSQNIYEWTDENGVKYYSNTEAGVPEQYRKDSNSVELGNDYNIGNDSAGQGYGMYDMPVDTFQGMGQVFKIPFTAFAGNARRIIVPVTINNSVTANFALDTGSPGMIISEGLAKKLGLYEQGSGMLLSVASGIGGQVTVMRTIVDEVSIGGAKESFVPAVITSAMSDAFEGLIGMDFMGNYSISIDNVNKYIVLQQNPGGENHPAGHNWQWWQNSFAEFRTYQQEWKQLSELVNEWEKDSRVNTSMAGGDVAKLKSLASWQYEESTKLLQRLERYAQQHNVPQSWRN